MRNLLLSLIILSIFLWLSSTLAKDKHSGINTTRYRISGVLLFANYDGYRVNFNVDDFVGMSLDEIIRKADGIFQRSEIQGTVQVHLPEGAVDVNPLVIFQRSNYDSFAFMQPNFFSVEFDMPEGVTVDNHFRIDCNLYESGGRTKSKVCEGSEIYEVRKVSMSRQTNKLINTPNDDITNGVIVQFLRSLGYEKLYTPVGAGNIEKVLETLLNYDWEGLGLDGIDWTNPMDIITHIPEILHALREVGWLLDDVSGVFLEAVSLEKISNDVENPGDYKKVWDFWSISDDEEYGLEELHGQLYLLPQAELLTICDLLEGLCDILPIPEPIKKCTLPFIKGPAFPLFDYTRSQELESDFSIDQGDKNPYTVYYKNPHVHSYVIFSNMWDKDGETAIEVDDCLAKGNILGFDQIDLESTSEYRLSQCDYSQDISIYISRGGIKIEEENGLVEYDISGKFDFWGKDGNGAEYDPYGKFALSISSRDMNWNFDIWRSQDPEESSDSIELNDYSHYNQPFKVRFQESEDFLTSTSLRFVFHGKVMESDPGILQKDDLLGNYDGYSYAPSDLTRPKALYFEGDHGAVTIDIQLRRVGKTGGSYKARHSEL